MTGLVLRSDQRTWGSPRAMSTKSPAAMLERSPILERDAGRTPAEIVEHRIWKPRQRHTPGVPELVVEQQGPNQANAIEHVSENVHACRLRPRTIGCKI